MKQDQRWPFARFRDVKPKPIQIDMPMPDRHRFTPACSLLRIGSKSARSLRRRPKAPLTEAQLVANIALVRYLAGRYESIDYLIGHSEYRQLERPAHPAHDLFHEELPEYRTEKIDPGRRFMKRLRRALRETAGPEAADG